MKRTLPYLLGIALIYTISLVIAGGAVQQTSIAITETTSPEKPEIILASSTNKQISTPSTISMTSVRLPILMYHYVRTVTNPHDTLGIDLSVSPDIFEEQMKYLIHAGYTTVTLDDLVAAWEGKTNLPDKPIILTFDDGYDDFYTAAFPILKKYNLKATTYIVPGFIDKPRYLTTSQLEELSASPLITIASHTLHHANVKNLTGSKLQEEIAGSKLQLEKFTGRAIHHFSYPSGFYSKEAIRKIKEAGYLTATTTESGSIHSSSAPFTITRIRVRGPKTLQDFEKNLHL